MLRARAFTIAELIVAIGLLAIIAVVIIGLFVRLTTSSSKSVDQSVAMEVANRFLDEYVDASPSQWDAVNSNVQLQTHDPVSKTTFYYKLRHRLVSSPAAQMGDLYRLDMAVSWCPNADPNLPRRDYGKLQVHLSRLVFVEDFH